MLLFYSGDMVPDEPPPPPPEKTKTEKIIMQKKMFTYPFLYGVGLTDGSFCSRNAAGDATVAFTHAPKFTADFLRAVKESKNIKERELVRNRNNTK